ncbi:MAG TPA: RNA ligase family protein, partial [Xanthomonadales bacterium]|nr:RNA ligase family protein [Xanthomonadales bacterium]
MSWKTRARALTGARPFVAPVLDLCRPTRVPATPEGAGWVHELKRDGYRMTVIMRDRMVRLVSRQGRDWTDRLRGIAERVRTLGLRDGQLDGEVIAVDAAGRDDFNALQRAMHDGEPAPLAFVAFDVMGVAGIDVTAAPLLERKALLRELVDGSPVAYSTHLEECGSTVFAEVARAGYEGVVSKRADSPYAGGTSRAWLKSMARLQDDFVAIGWMAPEGRSHGGLMVARVEDGALAYSGTVAAGV